MMKILVCVKQVPDMEGVIVREGVDGTVTMETSGSFHMNRFDEFAVEEALRLKETLGAVHIDIITVGCKAAVDVLKRAVGMGADAGIHVQTGSDADPGPAAAAAWIAGCARPKQYDLIMCGSMSEDGMHGQVGPMVAAHLNLPYATQVIALTPAQYRSEVSIEREIEGGVREMLVIRLPAVLALQPGINRPRYPSLSNLLRANRQDLEIVPVAELQSAAGLITCCGLVLPANMRASSVLGGSGQEKAEELVAILKQKAFF
jgi:electron transfer flavoprotein beta subunit